MSALLGAAFGATALVQVAAEAESINIVGIGAATYQEFLSDIKGRPDVEKNFFAWAQGYMSGILIRAPAGVDVNLNLAAPEFPLLKQVEFVRVYCEQHPEEDFTEAVNMLYRTLRAPPG